MEIVLKLFRKITEAAIGQGGWREYSEIGGKEPKSNSISSYMTVLSSDPFPTQIPPFVIILDSYQQVQMSAERSNRSSRSKKAQEQIQKRINYESPSKYDLDFYQRKVNRLENDLAQLQDELGLARFRLHKAEDFEIKYELLVKQNQTLTTDNDKLIKDLAARTRQLAECRSRLSNEELLKTTTSDELKKAQSQLELLKKKLDDSKDKGLADITQQKSKLQAQFNRQIDNLKSQHLDANKKLQAEISQLKELITAKESFEQTNTARLEKLRSDKNEEIKRLGELNNALRKENTDLKLEINDKILGFRNQLNEENRARVERITGISEATQAILMKEIEALNAAIQSKNSEIEALLAYQQSFLDEHNRTTNDLKAHIKRLQDKIFQIHRTNQLQLFCAIDKLKAQHDKDLKLSRDEFKRIQNQYDDRIRDLNLLIDKLKEEQAILESHLRQAETEHHKLAKDREAMVSNLSQTILKLEEQKDQDMRTMGASMKLIEEEAESKLRDLHHAILNKNEETEIMKAQMALKNKEISSLLDQMHKIRNDNRDRIGRLEDVYAKQAEILQGQLAASNKQIHQLKRQIHQLKQLMQDQQKQYNLEAALRAEDIIQLKQANQRLNKKNEMIREYVKELEDDLKVQRTRNVDFVQDTNVVRRQVVQQRQKVRGELQVLKEKELEQMRNIFNIDLNKLKTENANLAHRLRDKSDQYQKLLNDFKDLESKMSEEQRGKMNRAEDQARKKATLECEINLTRNIAKGIEKVAENAR